MADDSQDGYRFLERLHPTSPGYGQLQVFLPQGRGGSSFTPQYMRISVISGVRVSSHLTIYHPWEADETYHAAPDRILLRDFRGHTKEAFTYGGTLKIWDRDGFTECKLMSPAPIFELSDEMSVPTLLAAETEILLMELRTSALRAQAEKLLSASQPLLLYAATLNELNQRLGQTNNLSGPHVQLWQLVRDEMKMLQARAFHDGLPMYSDIAAGLDTV